MQTVTDADREGHGSYVWTRSRDPFEDRRSMGFTMTAVDPDVFRILTGEQ